MNRELRDLLSAAGYERARSPDAWSGMIVVNNFGSVPIPPGLSTEFAQKGFKLLLLDEQGQPAYFARCGASSDHALEREGMVLEALCGDPTLAGVVPATRVVASARLRILVNDYLSGRTYESLAARQPPDAWVRTSGDILALSERVALCAAHAVPDLLRGGPEVDLLEEARPRLGRLADAGVDAGALAAVERVLGHAGPLARRLQHGDLWAGNVIRYRGGWALIDFAEFGEAQVPMYDVFHMLQSNPGRRRGPTSQAWLQVGLGAVEDKWTDASRRVVNASAARLGLTTPEVAATLVYYLVHISAYRLREGVPREYGEVFIRELRRVADQLQRGVPLERLVAG
jgi:phosphotransferase family enzyme